MIDYGKIEARRAGNTYRMLLKAVFLASEGKDRKIYLLFNGRPAILNALHALRAIVAPTDGFATIKHTNSTAVFGNGSRIYLWEPSSMRTIHGMGEIFDYAVDTSLDRLDPELTQYLESVTRKN